MDDEEWDNRMCKCGHKRMRHRVSDGSCLDCDCRGFDWKR